MKHFHILFSVFFVLISSYLNAQLTDSIPRHNSFTINSKILHEERVINVWMPNEYLTKKRNELTVLYMLDGGINEDFPHLVNTLSQLIEKKEIQPVILVGIENTNRRKDFTSPSKVKYDIKHIPNNGGSEKFRAFLKQELFKEVKSIVRTGDKKVIIGESLAGLFILETCLKSPDLFDAYIAFDPSLWWNKGQLTKESSSLLKQFPTTEKNIWFASSKAKDISSHTKKLAKQLTEHASKEVIFHYSYNPELKHSTIFRAKKEEALKWLFSNTLTIP